jgi:para-aminobenzoate synthetase component 1
MRFDMMTKRYQASFVMENLETAKQKLLAWANTFPVTVYLDSNEYPQSGHHTWECLVAVGAADVFQAPAGHAFSGLQAFYDKKHDWLFGFFGYDLKNEVEKLRSENPNGIDFPELFFFQPEIVVGIRSSKFGVRSLKFEDQSSKFGVRSLNFEDRAVPIPGGSNEHISSPLLEIFSLNESAEEIFTAIQRHISNSKLKTQNSKLKTTLIPRIPKADYLKTVETIRQHIIEGDVYEMNLCQEFFAENTVIDPINTFKRLNDLARAPFSAYVRYHDRYLLCASPERFLRKEDASLISQPIKGTRRRHPDAEEDAHVREELRVSEKDRAENVMIVDLVRNDLARNCVPGSVQVEELFGIYSFQTVHQMISTVRGALRQEVHPVEALRDAFPMGSMTGAPKVIAMELIERYERTRRGLFSGAVGYFSPEGNFDFNVVIRSILYNASTRYLSCQVGGAIVYDSEPEQEYDECLVKMGAMRKALNNDE